MNETIERNFQYHQPKPGQPEKYQKLRAKAKELAYLIDELCPASAEQTLAMRKLQESIHWANASIAINQAETTTAPTNCKVCDTQEVEHQAVISLCPKCVTLKDDSIDMFFNPEKSN